MTPNKWGEMLKSIYPNSKLRHEIVVCGLSEPGIGKTTILYELRDWAKKNTEYKDCQVVEIIASQILPNEVSGITMPNGRSHSMEVYDHKRLSSLKDGDILFFDELLQGSPQVLSACLTLIQERRMMSGKMLPDVMIVAAANPTTSPVQIPEAIRQRFMFVYIDFDKDEWRKWIYDHYDVILNDHLLETVAHELNNKSNVWNKLSPRSCTKLLSWYLSGEIDAIQFADYTNCIFNDCRIAEMIVESCDKNKIQRDIVNIIDKYHEQQGTLEEWKSDNSRSELLKTSERDLKGYIEDLEEAEDIIKILSNIEYNDFERIPY